MKNEKVELKIVSLEQAHLPVLREIFLAGRRLIDPVGSKAMSLEDFDAETSREQLLVAVIGERPIGFISTWLPDNFIHHLYVEESYQEMGVGKDLLQHALRMLSGIVQLKCFVSNNRALVFPQDRGFKLRKPCGMNWATITC